MIGTCARVSSCFKPGREARPVEPLIRYCIAHKHWSIFEQANLCIRIETSRAISQQILRHRSFSFQEFSQRYSAVAEAPGDGMCEYKARRQDPKNYQGSLDDLTDERLNWFYAAQDRVWTLTTKLYQEALKSGIARECARMLLPMNTKTVLFMNGTVRSWLHYIELRTGPETQKEHREIAEACKRIFVAALPCTASAMGWTELEPHKCECLC